MVILDPTSPLLAGVTAFSESTTGYLNEHQYTVNGGAAVANWNSGSPFIVQGVVKGRKRVDLNIYPTSRDEFGFYNGVWTTDQAGVTIFKNACLYR